MCGRFTITRRDRAQLAADLGIPVSDLDDYAPRFNIAPTQPYFVLVTKYENRKAIPARWGLVNTWEKDNKRAATRINARAETVDRAPPFREAFMRRRCVVPADGFYEWRGPKNNREPLWFYPAGGGLLLMAGLYEAWQCEPDVWETTFTIITTTPNQTVAPIHNRMPVILGDRDADDWMNPRDPDPRALKRLLVPPPDDYLQMRPVSPLVNNANNEGPELLANFSSGSLF